MSSPAPHVDDSTRDQLAALRADLAAAPYTVEAVADVLGPSASAALHREQPTAARRILADDDSPVATMVALFTLGGRMSPARIEAAFPAAGVDGLTALGLLADDDTLEQMRGDGDDRILFATCDLRPYGDETSSWWLASDLSEIATGQVLEPDHVLGIGGASTTLARWTPRRTVRSALDLGTGCGVQAAHLAGHVEHIVASDLATRALAFVCFNAALNDLDVEVLAGSMLEPVAGRRFDLIVSNPPFVITPRRPGMPEYEYRDGGAVGDAVVRNLVRDVGAHLEPGGVAQFLGNWEMRDGETFEDVWERWLDGVDLDALVVQREVQDPCEYAELWARDGGAPVGSPEYDAMYSAWLDDFAARGVERIGFGIITLQRPAEPRPRFTDLLDERGSVATAMGPTIDAGLAARAWMARVGDDAVLDSFWQAAPDVTEERHTKPGASDPSVIMIRQGGGFGMSIQADTVLAAFLSVCDGSMTARTALEAIATLVDVPADDAVRGTLPLLKRLVANGFLTRVER